MELQNIRFYQNIQLDFFHLETKDVTNKDIFVNNYTPSLQSNSISLLTFDDSNNVQGVSSSALGYTFSVYRELNNSNTLDFITSLSDGELSITDYNIANKNLYTYYVFKEDDSVSSIANISNNVETSWWNWSVTALNKDSSKNNTYYVEDTDVWVFNLNIDSATVAQNFNKTTYLNLTKYPKISTGKTNYLTGGFTCLIGDIVNDKYRDTAIMQSEWNEFCNDGRLKLLKDRKGNKYIVEIMSNSIDIMDETVEQATTITVSWTQINNTDNMTIIGR